MFFRHLQTDFLSISSSLMLEHFTLINTLLIERAVTGYCRKFQLIFDLMVTAEYYMAIGYRT